MHIYSNKHNINAIQIKLFTRRHVVKHGVESGVFFGMEFGVSFGVIIGVNF
jgi:hypothetical protein